MSRAYLPPNLPGEDAVTRALTYPYPRPSHSFLYRDGRADPVPRGLDVNDPRYTAVVVIGSNGAPEQLRRKYGVGSDVEIPVLRVRVHHLDIVFSAGIAGYGSISSTVAYSPGTQVDTHVILLTQSQFQFMNSTERGYNICKLHCRHALTTEQKEQGQGKDMPFVEFVDEDNDHHQQQSNHSTNDSTNNQSTFSKPYVLMYVASFGPLLVNDRPVSFADFTARNRQFPAWREPQAIAHVAQAVDPESVAPSGSAMPDADLHRWIERVVRDEAYRARARAQLHVGRKFVLDDCFEIMQNL